MNILIFKDEYNVPDVYLNKGFTTTQKKKKNTQCWLTGGVDDP